LEKNSLSKEKTIALIIYLAIGITLFVVVVGVYIASDKMDWTPLLWSAAAFIISMICYGYTRITGLLKDILKKLEEKENPPGKKE